IPLVEQGVGGAGDLLAPLIVDVPLRVDDGEAVPAVDRELEPFRHDPRSPSARLAHDHGRPPRSRLYPDLVHQTLDDFKPPAPLAVTPELLLDAWILPVARREADAVVVHRDLERLGPLGAADAEGDVDLADRGVAVLERVDAGLHHRH